MRWQTYLHFSLSGAGLFSSVNGSETCSTAFGPKTQKTVPTRTATFKGPSTTTVNTYATVTTIIITQTYFVVHGNKTTTVPTPSNFKPLTSATTIPEAMFAQSVTCNSTMDPTKTITKTIRHTTSPLLLTVSTTNTTTVATSTAYAACDDPNNVLSHYHGNRLGYTYGRSGTQACSNEYDHPGNPACLNPRTCCELAWSLGNSGFFYQESDRSCEVATSNFTFFSGAASHGEVYFGNGPEGAGEFGGTYISFQYYETHPGFS